MKRGLLTPSGHSRATAPQSTPPTRPAPMVPLTPLEIAVGMVLAGSKTAHGQEGADRDRPPALEAGEPEARRDPIGALEREILPALQRPPCLVSFSGGRDSAAVLAIAASLARREGLELPIPATNLFPRAPGSEEGRWQQQVVSHLELEEWVRIEHFEGLDVIGPHARRVLTAHGLLWPPNVHFHLPLLEAANGGSLLTGIGGDELFAAARCLRAAAVLSRTVRPRARDLLTVGFALAPLGVRQAVIERRQQMASVWLRPRARRIAAAIVAAEDAAEPRQLRDRLEWWHQRRYLGVGLAGLELVARDTNVLLAHPLLAIPFWRAVGEIAGPTGFASRTEGMRRLFGHLLPEEILARRSKAHFDEALWTEESQTFASCWDGSGVPEAWVDMITLARHWETERPSAQSYTLLQAAWLAAAPATGPGAVAHTDARKEPSR